MEYSHLIIFKYDNAYDVYSANALSEKGQFIFKDQMDSEVAILFVTKSEPIIEVMNEFGFTYRHVDLTEFDQMPLIRSSCNFDI